MKWFKHLSNMSESDEGIFLLHKYGLPGIARWFLILEMIARFMDMSSKCYRVLPIQEWCKVLMINKGKLLEFLADIQDKLNIHWTYDEPMLKIEVPNLVELRDETTRKKQNKKLESGVNQEQDIETEVDKDLDIERNNNDRQVDLSFKSKNKTGVETTDWKQCFEEIWKEYPNKVGKKAAMKHFKASVMNFPMDFENIKKALANYVKSEVVRNGFIQHGSTWFNNWQDWVEYKDPKQVLVEKEREKEKAKIKQYSDIVEKPVGVPCPEEVKQKVKESLRKLNGKSLSGKGTIGLVKNETGAL